MHIRYRETFAAGWSALEKRLLPSYVWTSDPLTFWRERILFLICFIAAVFGPIALVPSLLLAYSEGLWIVILVDSLAYMAAVTILIARNASFVVRALVICFIFYALGVCILFILGPVGAGYIWLFGASVLISTFIGLGAAIWTLVFNTIVMLSVGIFIAYGNPAWILHMDNALEKWLVMSTNFLLLNAFVTITTAFMLNGLKTALLMEQKISKSLRESEELFRSYLEYAPDGVYMSDLEGNFLYGNRKCEEIIGYRREELIGKNFLELNILSEKSLNKAAQLLQANIEGKPTGPDEIELISKEGRLIPVEINTSVVQRMGQRIVLAFVRDITERKQAEEKLALNFEIQAAMNILLGLSLEGRPVKEFLYRALDLVLSLKWLAIESKGAIFLTDKAGETLHLQVQKGFSKELCAMCKTVPFGHCLCGRAAAARAVQFADRVDERHDTHYEGMPPHGHYCVPILSGDHILGVIVLYVKEGHTRSPWEEDFPSMRRHLR